MTQQIPCTHAVLHYEVCCCCGMNAEVEEGGETTLPLADAIDEEAQTLDHPSQCAARMGIAVRPRKGMKPVNEFGSCSQQLLTGLTACGSDVKTVCAKLAFHQTSSLCRKRCITCPYCTLAGDALLFFDMDVAGSKGDRKALHASCPTLMV